MKYKLEMSLLLIAITLFSLSAIFYSYSFGDSTVSFDSGLNSYPYSRYAIALVGFGSIFMLAASLSFSRRSKNVRDKSYQI
jgi:hypothetical protein